jgi:hypothetical protein
MSGPCEQAPSKLQATVAPTGTHDIFFTQPIYSSSYPRVPFGGTFFIRFLLKKPTKIRLIQTMH